MSGTVPPPSPKPDQKKRSNWAHWKRKNSGKLTLSQQQPARPWTSSKEDREVIRSLAESESSGHKSMGSLPDLRFLQPGHIDGRNLPPRPLDLLLPIRSNMRDHVNHSTNPHSHDFGGSNKNNNNNHNHNQTTKQIQTAEASTNGRDREGRSMMNSTDQGGCQGETCLSILLESEKWLVTATSQLRQRLQLCEEYRSAVTRLNAVLLRLDDLTKQRERGPGCRGEREQQAEQTTKDFPSGIKFGSESKSDGSETTTSYRSRPDMFVGNVLGHERGRETQGDETNQSLKQNRTCEEGQEDAKEGGQRQGVDQEMEKEIQDLETAAAEFIIDVRVLRSKWNAGGKFTDRWMEVVSSSAASKIPGSVAGGR